MAERVRGAVLAVPQRLSFAQALESPCTTCDTSPCCRFLPLDTFELRTLLDLDHARYLVGFERIELGVSPDGGWHVHYRQPCRHLDPATASCTVYATDRQPHLCTTYPAHACWYRGALAGDLATTYLRIDRRRLDHILERVELDHDRNVVGAPTWSELLDAFADLPLEIHDDQSAADDELVAGAGDGGAGLIAGAASASAQHRFVDAAVQDPCASCAAYCCRTLMFPLDPPVDAAAVDHLRFCLGFPGVEVVVTDGVWALAVATTCRHLDGDRCGLFGDPKRPLRCSGYDAWSCQYRPLFDAADARSLRLSYDDLDPLAACLRFDDQGGVGVLPPVDAIRAAVGAARAARVPGDTAGGTLPLGRPSLPLLASTEASR